MNDVVSLLNLPTATLIALAGGYAGYRIWATGKDAGHGAMDVVFGSLVFALISRLATTGMESAGSPVILLAGEAARLEPEALRFHKPLCTGKAVWRPSSGRAGGGEKTYGVARLEPWRLE